MLDLSIPADDLEKTVTEIYANLTSLLNQDIIGPWKNGNSE